MPRRTVGDIGGAFEAVRKLPAYARLVWGLARDERVPGAQKLILVGIVGYLLMPIDIIPDFLPILGQLDDVAIVLLGLDFFIKAAPADVVDEHLARISKGRDDLASDLDEVQSLLGDTFGKLRDELTKILDRQRTRFSSVDEAVTALEEWQSRPAGPANKTKTTKAGTKSRNA